MDLLGCTHSFFEKCIQFQLYGKMTLDNCGKNREIDHTLLNNSFNLLNENEVKKDCFFLWINLRPLFGKEINF